MNYAEMNVAELEQKNNELKAQESAIKTERRKLAGVMSEKLLKADAERLIHRIGLEQAGKIHQVITEAGGIQSLAKVGTPGA